MSAENNGSSFAVDLYPNSPLPAPALTIRSGLGLNIIAGWWKVLSGSNNAGKLWAASTTTYLSLQTNSAPYGLTLGVGQASLNGIYFSTAGADITADTWTFIATVLGRTSATSNQHPRVWMGTDTTPPAAVTWNNFQVGSGALTSQDNLGLLANPGVTTDGIRSRVGQVWSVSMPNVASIGSLDLDTYLLDRFIGPMWRGTFDPLALSNSTAETTTYGTAAAGNIFIKYAPLDSAANDTNSRPQFPWYQVVLGEQYPVRVTTWTGTAGTYSILSSDEPPRRSWTPPTSPRLNPTFARV